MSPEPEPYQDDEDEEYAPQSIFAAGWFRAVLVLTVLAIVVVVSLPYLLNWFEPTPTIPQPAPRASVVPPAPAPSAPAEPRSAEPRLTAPQVTEPKPAEPRAVESKPDKPPERAKAEPKPAAALPKAAEPAGSYWLQLGLFKDQANAESLAKSVREQGFAVEIRQIAKRDGGLPPGTYHLVRAGGFPDRASAGKAREALGAKGHQGFVTKSGAP